MPGEISIVSVTNLGSYIFKAIREGGGRHSVGLGKTPEDAIADLLSNEDAHKDCEDCAKEEASDG